MGKKYQEEFKRHMVEEYAKGRSYPGVKIKEWTRKVEQMKDKKGE